MSSVTTLHPALPQLGRLMTFDEWVAMDEDEPGELVDGRLEEEEVPDPIHEIIVTWLAHVLRTWLGGKRIFLGSGVKYAIRPNRGRKPDLAVDLSPAARPPPRPSCRGGCGRATRRSRSSRGPLSRGSRSAVCSAPSTRGPPASSGRG